MANVPPLSSGRIRKRGRINSQRPSPWYFTTGEGDDGVVYDHVRPSASTACWAALARYQPRSPSLRTCCGDKASLVDINVRGCQSRATAQVLQRSDDRLPVADEMVRVVLNVFWVHPAKAGLRPAQPHPLHVVWGLDQRAKHEIWQLV